MPHSFLDNVRLMCRKVAEQAMFVQIEHGALEAYAASLPVHLLGLPQMDPAIHCLGKGNDSVAYFLTLDAINFGSGYFPEIFENIRPSGYRMVAAALNDHFAKNGPFSADDLIRLKVEECTRLFIPGHADPAARELMGLFAAALNELGRFVARRFDGEICRIVEEAGGSAERLAATLAQMRFFKDAAAYREVTVPFYKRAQLAAADLHIAFAGERAGRFVDLDRLTICADNLVPHVLRLDGVLTYREELARRIDRGEPIPAGAPEEVEIRACAVHAAELIIDSLHRRGSPVNAMMLDNFLWHRGQETAYRARPRHRTKTAFY